MAVSAFAQASVSDRDFADINVTPLVDVLLVLLIIFMVTAPTLTKAVEFTLPGVTPPDAERIEPQRIRLTIAPNGDVAWNGVAQPFSALASDSPRRSRRAWWVRSCRSTVAGASTGTTTAWTWKRGWISKGPATRAACACGRPAARP